MSMMNSVSKFIVKFASVSKLSKMTEKEFEDYCDKKLSNQKSTPGKAIYKNFDVTEHKFNGQMCYEIKAKDKDKRKDSILIAVHGGAYIIEVGYLNWIAVSRIINETGSTVFVPIYPLCPKHNYEETFDMMKEMYSYIVEQYPSAKKTIMGESAGAQISLSFCQYINELNMPQMQDVVLVSPPVMLEPTDAVLEKMKECEKRDPVLSAGIFPLMAKGWTRGTSADNYLVSPIYGDFSNLPRISVFMGTDEVLYPFAEMIIQKAKEYNADITYYEGEKMIHTWPFFFFIPEGEKSMTDIINIINKE